MTMKRTVLSTLRSIPTLPQDSQSNGFRISAKLFGHICDGENGCLDLAEMAKEERRKNKRSNKIDENSMVIRM